MSWYYDDQGNFVGDEDRPSQDDHGYILSEDEYNYLRQEAKIEKAVEEGTTGTVDDYDEWDIPRESDYEKHYYG